MSTRWICKIFQWCCAGRFTSDYTSPVAASSSCRRDWWTAYHHVPRYIGTQGAALAANCSTNRVQTVPACPQVDRQSSASVYEKPRDYRRRCSIVVSALRSYEGELCRTEDSPQARGEGVFRRCSTSVESSSNRPQNVAFYSCIQVLFKNFFVSDSIQCLISRPLYIAFTLKLFWFYRFLVCLIL